MYIQHMNQDGLRNRDGLPGQNRKFSRSMSLVGSIQAVVSVAGPSIGHILQVNACIVFTTLFFVATWMAFFATTMGIFLTLTLASRVVIEASLIVVFGGMATTILLKKRIQFVDFLSKLSDEVFAQLIQMKVIQC